MAGLSLLGCEGQTAGARTAPDAAMVLSDGGAPMAGAEAGDAQVARLGAMPMSCHLDSSLGSLTYMWANRVVECDYTEGTSAIDV